MNTETITSKAVTPLPNVVPMDFFSWNLVDPHFGQVLAGVGWVKVLPPFCM
jgi:hypothetical protein